MTKIDAIRMIKDIRSGLISLVVRPNRDNLDDSVFQPGYDYGYIAALMDAFGISEGEITVNTNALQELTNQFGIKAK